jgi:uncharacterized membrane protein (DUF2068 family)
MPTENCSARSSGRAILRLIAVEKLVKAILLILLGVGALRMVHRDLPKLTLEVVRWVHVDANNQIVHQAIARVARIDARRLREIGVGSFLYAALFLVEGVGLWRDKRWAEYLTVISTSLLIPVEVVEIIRRLTAARIIVLLINIGIVIYLIVRLRQKHGTRRSAPCPHDPGPQPH